MDLHRRLIPSMFHRRLLLLLLMMGLGTSVLAGQLFRLTIIQGTEHRRAAEESLIKRRLVPTIRGRILDRKERVLAQDMPCFDVAVDYEMATGHWAYRKARSLAYADNKGAWGKFTFDEREALITPYRRPFDAQLEALWQTLAQLGKVDRAELDRRADTELHRIQMIRAEVWSQQMRQRALETGLPVELAQVAIPVMEEREPLTILAAVEDSVAYEIRKRSKELPGVHVVASKKRHYAMGQLSVTLPRQSLPSHLRSDQPMNLVVENSLGHLMGRLGEVGAEALERRPFRGPEGSLDLAGYLAGDMKGVGGVEQAAEDVLRGWRGQMTTRADSPDETIQKPVAGGDIHLTVDMALQGRIQAMMDPRFGLMRVQDWHANPHTPSGTPLYGAVVVMEVATGQVLATVSTPMPPGPGSDASMEDLSTHPDRPLVNKAVAGLYEPGSTLKPIVYCIAAAQGAVAQDVAVDCNGHFLKDKPELYRCWIYKRFQQTHGKLAPVEALARSCNIFFYTCGHNLRAERLIRGLNDWGFGRTSGTGLPEEISGLMPRLDGNNPPGRELSVSNAILMGIGQGPIAVPPIQVAAAHATLARGGILLSPLLIREYTSSQTRRDLKLPAHVLDNTLTGMQDAANAPHGTAHHLNLPGGREPILTLPDVVVRAKTGTATAPDQQEMVRRGNRLVSTGRIVRSGEHSWFVCHLQKPGTTQAAYVVVVMVEYGGSGAAVSGPLANQVLHALKDEGYL